MSGPGPEGDIWDATIHSSSTQDISIVHPAFVTFATKILGNDGIGPMWPDNQSCTTLQTTLLDAAGKNLAQAQTAISLVGSGTGKTLPQRVSVVVSLRTDTPTRSGRGRFYLPPMDADHLQTNGEIVASDALSLAQTVALAIGTMGTTAVPVIYHRGQNTGTPISRVDVNTVWGTQRRRTNKVAANYQTASV